MRTTEAWLSAYSATHQNFWNRRIHTFCVPAILFSIVGALSLLRMPGMDLANGATVFALAALGFYARLGHSPFLLMLLQLSLCGATSAALERFTAWPLLYLYSAIFVIAWIGQFIGPLWVFFH